jgi:beta-lactamase regulating signal transducer with metallopeptidase domain
LLTTIHPYFIGRWLIFVWAAVSAGWAVVLTVRITRFRHRLRWALPAPGWLEDEAQRAALRLGVRSPQILVLPGQASPMLWVLGRPRLLVPAALVDSIGLAAWRCILAHELGHLLRRDHWVRRLELAARLLWWWNPLYWLTSRRLDAEAELACDEWAVASYPDGRLAYAEALLEVCRSLSSAKPPSPMLGVTGSGMFLERRVTMILRESKPSRASTWILAGASLMGLLALPAWSAPAPSVQETAELSAIAPDDDQALASPNDDDQQVASIEKQEAEREQARIEEEVLAEENERVAAARERLAAATELASRHDADDDDEKGSKEAKIAAKIAEAKKRLDEAEARAKKRAAEAEARAKQRLADAQARASSEIAEAKKKLAAEAAAIKRSRDESSPNDGARTEDEAKRA